MIYRDEFDSYADVAALDAALTLTQSGDYSLVSGLWGSGQAIYINQSTVVEPYYTVTLDSNYATVYFCFYYKYSVAGTGANTVYILRFKDGTIAHGSLRLINKTTLEWYHGNASSIGTVAMSEGDIHKIHGYLFVNDTTGRIVVYLDDVNWLDYTGDSKQTTHEYLNNIIVEGGGGISTSTNIKCTIDHIVFTDYPFDEFKDDANNWSDSASVSLADGAGVLALTETFTDSFSLLDALTQQIDLIETVVSDQLALSDSTVFEFPLGLEDTDQFTLLDATALFVGYFQQIADDAANLSDALAIHFNYWILQTDTLSQSDAVASLRNSVAQLTDGFVLDDYFRVVFNKGGVAADTLSASDSVSFGFNYLPDSSDTLSMSEVALVNLAVWQPFDVSDLMTLNDAVSIYASTSEDDYFRRHLDDRNLKVGERKTFYCDRITMRDEVLVA